MSFSAVSIERTQSVVIRGASLRMRVPGVMDWIAIRPFPFPGIVSSFQTCEEMSPLLGGALVVWRSVLEGAIFFVVVQIFKFSKSEILKVAEVVESTDFMLFLFSSF